LVFIYFIAANFHNDCVKPLPLWIIIQLVLFAINTVFGCYIYRRVSRLGGDTDDPTKHPKWQPNLNFSRNMFNIQLDFWMNDPLVCIHIVFSIFSIVWSILGLVWAGNSRNDVDSNPCPNDLMDASTAAAIIMLIFIAIGLFLVVSALCTGYLEHCLNDCSLWHCLCCCFYYPFFYHYDPNYESQSARQLRERQHHGVQQVNSPIVVAVHQPVVVAQPVMQHQPVVGVPIHQPVYTQPMVQQGGYMQTPQQGDFQRRSFQTSPATAQPVQTVQQPPSYQQASSTNTTSTYGSTSPTQPSSQPPADNVEKAKQKAAAVAEATGEKLKEGAQALKEWWNKPKDGPRN